MNDEAAFVAAIAAAPEDEHLPLIFADWLDDHGDPRGQWLRNYYVRQWMPPTYENPVPKLLEALTKNKKVIDVRRAAAVIGEAIVPGLVGLLKHETPRVRQQACICLRNIGKRAKAAAPALLEVFRDPDHNVREQAAKALKDIGAAGVTDTDQLKAALTDDNWSVRRVASKVLGSMKAKGSVLQELVEKFDSPDTADRLEVIEGLAQLGTADVIPTLDRALDDPEAEVREKAVQALGRVKTVGVVPPLCRAMKDRVANVRKTAADQFGGYNWNVTITPEAVAALTALLNDKVPKVRVAACGTLAKAGGTLTKSLVPRIIALLADLSPEVQLIAIDTLSEIARDDKAARKALIAELANFAPEHRRRAAHALGAVGPNDPVVLAALVPLLNDPSEDVAATVTGVIGNWEKLPASVAAPLLARLAQVRDHDQWGYAIMGVLGVLGRIEAPPVAVIEALREAVRNPAQGYGQTAAIEALAALGPAAVAAIPELVALFPHDDQNRQYYYTYNLATKALVRIGGRGFDELAALLDGNGDAARWYVLQGLQELRAAALPLLPAMLRLYHRTEDEWRRGQVVEAIRNLGPGAVAALPDLFAALEGSGPPHVRANAIQVLQGFGSALVPHLPRLIELARRPEFADLQIQFASLFASFAPREPAVREALRDLLRAAAPIDTNDWNTRWSRREVRQRCAAALLAFKDVALLPDLAPLVTDPEVDIRRDLIYQLDGFDTPAALPLIRQALTDTEEMVRLRVIEVLVRRADSSDESIAALVHAVEDRVPKVRRAAIDALNKLNVGTDEVLAVLSDAAEDDDKKVAERAGIALRKLTPKEPKAKLAKAKKDTPPTKGKKKPK